MRRIHKALSTGCFFLCLGGWGYNGQAIAEDLVKDEGTHAIVASVAAAAVPVGEAPATAPATQPGSTNLKDPVFKVDVDGTIHQFSVQDMDINTALTLLSMQAERNIIASKDVKGVVTASFYKVSFTEALDALLMPNGFGYVEKGNFIYVYTQKELEEIRKRERKTVNKVFHLKYLTAADASVLIKPALSATGQIALTPPAVSGLPTGSDDVGGPAYATDDTLVVNDYAEHLVEIEKTLAALDIRPKQVLVEATILRATLEENNALGVDLVSLSGIDFSTLTSVAASSDTGVSAPGKLAGATVANGSDQFNAGTDFASKVPTGGLSIGFLSNNVSIFLRALEETSDTTVVANPKILALNKHRGEVFVGQQFGYKTTTSTQTTTQETVEFLDTGTKLIFRPYITDDGYVRMEIHPEDSSGGLNASNLPTKQSTEVTSNIMIKDGRTVVIGGLFREQTVASRGQVPVLGNIPILGVPFRRTNDSTARSETIVLITPHIINDDTALYEESRQRQEDVTRMMLGNRAGLQPWGRNRLAQTWFAKAQESLENGNRDKALMYTDWALNTAPSFPEALKLRQMLTNQRLRESDNSTLSSFARDVIRADGLPPAGFVSGPKVSVPTRPPAGILMPEPAVVVPAPAIEVEDVPATQPLE